MLLSISLISIAMLSAVVNAQYGGYGAGSRYTQQVQQYGQPSYQRPQQYSQPAPQPWQQYNQLSSQQWQQPAQSSFRPWQQPFQPGSGQWQQNGGSAFQSYQQQSSYTPTLSPSDQCGKIADDNGLIPFNNWGRMTESMKIAWGQQGCDQQMCQYWTKKYGIRPFETGGSIPSSLHSAWEHKQMECNFRVGPYSPAQCKYAADRFNAGPLGIWGTMPDYARTFWTQGNCDVKMCGIWKDKYGVIKGQTYGSMPDGFKRMWDDPRLSCTDKI
ncbi:hypothetical protein BASA61_001985 [Batrachochytrium salamandrivorans]|nr:hypothetical protein BASA61_001985 [Batrachochytrium salamandrivorans]KAH9264377.1 hypothetical protein BASA83_012134 [Batrachochytrium salamandrivorans]